jgi:hypothetical protein
MAALSDQTNVPAQPEDESTGREASPQASGPAAPPPPPLGWEPAGEPPQTATAVAPPPPPTTPPGAVATGEAPERRREGSGRAPLWIGLILVIFGIAVLAGQTLPGVSVWMLWPLIIIVAGAVQAVTPGRHGWNVNRLFDGLVTIAFGLVLLGNTTGIIGWSVWWRFIWLWPVLLIAAGIGIIGRAIGQRWIGMIGSILVILALGYAAATTYAGAPTFSIGVPSTGAHTLSYSAPVLGATGATLELDAGAGDVRIGGGTDLVKVDAASPWGQPTASVDRTASTARVKVVMSQGSGGVYIPGRSSAHMDLELSRDVAWDATINSGAVSLDADLADVPVNSLELKTGVSDSTLKFGAPDMGGPGQGGKLIRVRSGVSSVTLQFPASASVRIRFQTGLSGNKVPSGYQKVGDVWESPGFTESGAFWDVTVESGVGSSVIETY